MKHIILILIIVAGFLPLLATDCCPTTGKPAVRTPVSTSYSAIMTRAGRKYQIDANHFVKFSWNRRPQIANRILMIELLDSNNRKITNLQLTANAYMPSMRGAHDTGDKAMQLNRSQQYAIPVHFMMAGDWEIEIKIKSGNRLIGNPVVRLNI